MFEPIGVKRDSIVTSLERNYTIEDYLTTIREFLSAVASEPVTVIASSLTAAFTIRLAIEHHLQDDSGVKSD